MDDLLTSDLSVLLLLCSMKNQISVQWAASGQTAGLMSEQLHSAWVKPRLLSTSAPSPRHFRLTSSPLWLHLKPLLLVLFLPVCVGTLHDLWPIRLFFSLDLWPLHSPLLSRTDFENRWMTWSCLLSLVFLPRCSFSSTSSLPSSYAKGIREEFFFLNMELEFCFVFPVLLRLEPDFVAYFYFSELMTRGELLNAVASWWLLLFAPRHADETQLWCCNTTRTQCNKSGRLLDVMKTVVQQVLHEILSFMTLHFDSSSGILLSRKLCWVAKPGGTFTIRPTTQSGSGKIKGLLTFWLTF